MQHTLNQMSSTTSDMYLLQETDVNSHVSQNYHDIKYTINSLWEISTLQITITPTSSFMRNPKGGVISIVQVPLTGKIKEKRPDLYGRWSFTHLDGIHTKWVLKEHTLIYTNPLKCEK